MGLSSHQSARMKNDEWLTPPEILAKLGAFDLDPCSPIVRPWDTAKRHFTINDDGLSQKWYGRVWLNPPFGNQAIHWLRKMAEHGNGIALIPARTETKMWRECIWGAAEAILFMDHRPHFHYVDGTRAKANSGAPIALVAYSHMDAHILAQSKLGVIINSWEPTNEQ